MVGEVGEVGDVGGPKGTPRGVILTARFTLVEDIG